MSISCEAVKFESDIRFVSLYVIIVFIRLFNCVDLIMQPKIEMVFRLCLFSFIVDKKRNSARAHENIETEK